MKTARGHKRARLTTVLYSSVQHIKGKQVRRGTQLAALATAAAGHTTPTCNWDRQINAECEDLAEKTVLGRGRLKPTARALQSQRARQAEALPVWGCSWLLSAHTASCRLSPMRQSKLGLGREGRSNPSHSSLCSSAVLSRLQRIPH